MSGQSIADRVMAAKHSIAGQGLSKSVYKATTEEVMGPKKKHLDYLIQCTNEPNVSIPQLANVLIERTQHQNWVVVFKSLITVHNLMNYGNERFTQYLASNNCTFNLGNFLDKQGVQGYDMSTFIRRYSKYLNEKAFSYRTMAFDFCKVKRGKDDGMLRTMNTEKLLKTLPVLQGQIDALLEFDCSPNELTNGVINACFMLLFKDLIRLFACYNDGIINLLEKYFEMNKKQCREALDIYKKFLVRMERVSEFLKVAESVGIDKGDIPDLAKAPSSLLEALEAHLQTLEAQKKGGSGGAKTPTSVTSAINNLTATSNSANAAAISLSETEKKKILEEEQLQLDKLKAQKQGNTAAAASTNPFASVAPAGGTDLDLLGATSTSATSTSKASDDLLGLSGPNPFASMAASSGPQPAQQNNPFGAPAWGTTPAVSAGNSYQPPAQQATSNGSDSFAQFDTVFGNTGPPNSGSAEGVSPSHMGNPGMTGFDGFGEVMKPINQGDGPKPAKKEDKLIKGDLDSSLANLVGNLSMKPGENVKKSDHNWKGGPTKGLTGGTGWQAPMAPTSMAPASSTFQQQSTLNGAYNGMYMARVPQMQPMGPGYQSGGSMMAGQQQGGMMGFQQPRPMGQQTMQGAGFKANQTQNQNNDPFGAL